MSPTDCSRRSKPTYLTMLAFIALSLCQFSYATQNQPEPQPQTVPAATSNTALNLTAAAASQASFDSGSVFFVGNATVIIKYAGFTILTDPNFLHRGEHVHLGYGLKSKRLTNPAISLDKLPPIDLVVLSHFHDDHFDQLVQKKLDRNIPIVTTEEAKKDLNQLGFTSVHGISKWNALTVNKGKAKLNITAAPARHGPVGASVALPDTMGSILEFSEADKLPKYRIYITGDTLMHDEIQEIANRYPDIDLALLHLGGTKILKTVLVTMDAKQGVEMMKVVAPEHAIPIHYNDYDVFKSPIEDFQNAIEAAGLRERITYLKHGEVYKFQPRAR